MTYMVAWDLEVDLCGEDKEAIKAALFETDSDEYHTLGDLVSYDGYYVENVNDENLVADFLPLSEAFPSAVFELTRTDCQNFTGPDEPRWDRYYVRNGRCMEAKVEVVIEPFDEGKLRDLEGSRA